MDCSGCGATLPPISNPTQRYVTCGKCAATTDLAVSMANTGEVDLSDLPPADPNPGRTLAGGRYRVDEVLGQGGMGTVYLGTQPALGRKVAIKILAPEFSADEQFRKRFEREAGALAALDHPHIVSVHDLGIEDDTHYIVMSFVEGPDGKPMSLRDLVAAGPVEEELALRILHQVSGALHFAHGRGIVHRDIKPGNILLDADGNAKLADFGIARVSAAPTELTLTLPGSVMGTLKYMAPEQKADAKAADARSDLYSLGVVFYEMLTGHAPEGRFELPSEIRKELDPRVDRIVERALQRAIEARYQSADDLSRDISEITTEREYGKLRGRTKRPAPEAAAPPSSPPPKSPPTPTPPPPRPTDLPPAPPRPGPGGGAGSTPPPPRPSPGGSRPSSPPAERTQKKRPTGVVVLAVLLLAAAVAGFAIWGDELDFGGGGGGGGRTVLPGGGRSAAASRVESILGGGRRLSPADFRSIQRDLEGKPAPAGTGPAKAATAAALGLQYNRDYAALGEQIPERLVPVLARCLKIGEGEVRQNMANSYSNAQLMNYEVRDAVAVDYDMVLVLYVIRGYDGGQGENVAIAVRENGRWKVLL